jgi:hypothetical protein
VTLRTGRDTPTRFCRATWPVGVLAALALSVPGSADAAGIGTQLFTTSGEQTFTVPAAVTSVQVTLVGGNGGNGQDGGVGGIPATVTATLVVVPGQTLYAEVAGNGTNAVGGSAGGYGGGGNGGLVTPLFFATPGGGGGGGASDVRTCSVDASGGCSGVPSLATRLVVAGGGGGGGGGGDESNAAGSITGGNGGSADQPGSVGQVDTDHDAAGGGAGQGTASGGGAPGSGEAGSSGTLGLGGTGGVQVSGGGGGGGGIYGGGGGGGGDYSTPSMIVYASGAGGGGGGASGVPAAARGVSGFSLVPTATGAQPSVSFTWTLPPPTVITGAVTGITTTTAAVSGTVNPNAYQLTSCYFQVSPAPSGGATFPCAQQLPVASSPVPVSATLAGLSPGTTYAVTLVSASAQGTASGSAVSFLTAGSAAGPGASPIVSGLKLTPSRFRSGKQVTKLGRAGKVGTTISFRLSTAATIKLTFARVLPKRAAHRDCETAKAALRLGALCARSAVATGAVSLNVRAGQVKLRFEGVLNGGHRLKAGTYVLSLVARTKSGHASVARHARFTLLR